MIGVVPTQKIYLACGATDMRKGIDGLAVLVQEQLARDPHSGAVFVFRGRRDHLIKVLCYDGQEMCLFYKRLDLGILVWPWTFVSLTPAQLSMLL
jgi:transposase